jgi:hypothetical protein
MNEIPVEQLEEELARLIQKQAEFVEMRSLGGATDSEILEYEVRQEMVQEICDRLRRSTGV